MFRLLCLASLFACSVCYTENLKFCQQTGISSIFQLDQSIYFQFSHRTFVWEPGMDVPVFERRISRFFYFFLDDQFKSRLSEIISDGFNGFLITNSMGGETNLGLLTSKHEGINLAFKKTNDFQFTAFPNSDQKLRGFIEGFDLVRSKSFLYIPKEKILLAIWRPGRKYN